MYENAKSMKTQLFLIKFYLRGQWSLKVSDTEGHFLFKISFSLDTFFV